MFYMKVNVLQDLHIWISVPLRWLLLYLRLVFQPRKMLKSAITWHNTVDTKILNHCLLDGICVGFHVSFRRWSIPLHFKAEVLQSRFILSFIQLDSILDGEGGAQKGPPSRFSLLTYINLGISLQNFLTFSFNPFATMV